MAPRCKNVRYVGKRVRGPVVRARRPPTSPGPPGPPDEIQELFHPGEEDESYLGDAPQMQENPLAALRDWVTKQRFIPQDLSDDFLLVFLSAAGYMVDAAADQMHKYFYSRQEPSPLFVDRDPLSPGNEKIFRKLYVLPMPDTTDDGKKIILTGLVEPTVSYDQVDHAKILAMVLDLLIWEKDFGFGDFVVVFDGRQFNQSQLLENKVPDHKRITSLLQDTIPGMLRAFYFLYPPEHLKNVAGTRDGIWMTVVRSKREMIGHLPADILPLEFGGNLGHLGDLLEQWHLHLIQNRDFFIQFEKRMAKDYRRRLCREKEMRDGGRFWVHKMKLEADEWEYKLKYYERMRTAKPLTHPAFGVERLFNAQRRKPAQPEKDPLEKWRRLAREEAERDLVLTPPKTYNGYAKEILREKLQREESGPPACNLLVFEFQ